MDKLKISLVFLWLTKLLNYDCLLVIPKINFFRSFNYKDELVDSLKIIIDKSKVILGHSGYGTNAYFNNLIYLNLGDKIIFKDKTILIYEIFCVDKIDKGSEIFINNDSKYLYLITCDINNLETKQVIIGSKLVEN